MDDRARQLAPVRRERDERRRPIACAAAGKDARVAPGQSDDEETADAERPLDLVARDRREAHGDGTRSGHAPAHHEDGRAVPGRVPSEQAGEDRRRRIREGDARAAVVLRGAPSSRVR